MTDKEKTSRRSIKGLAGTAFIAEEFRQKGAYLDRELEVTW